MFKGYRNRIIELDKTNKSVSLLPHMNKCLKCRKLNPSLQSPAINNVQLCMYCGTPFYLIRNNGV